MCYKMSDIFIIHSSTTTPTSVVKCYIHSFGQFTVMYNISVDAVLERLEGRWCGWHWFKTSVVGLKTDGTRGQGRAPSCSTQPYHRPNDEMGRTTGQQLMKGYLLGWHDRRKCQYTVWLLIAHLSEVFFSTLLNKRDVFCVGEHVTCPVITCKTVQSTCRLPRLVTVAMIWLPAARGMLRPVPLCYCPVVPSVFRQTHIHQPALVLSSIQLCTVGNWAFPVADSHIWNCLPRYFRRWWNHTAMAKPFLFGRSFPSWFLVSYSCRLYSWPSTLLA